MTTSVKNDEMRTKQAPTLHRPGKQYNGLFPYCVIRGTKIDEIGSVQDYWIKIVHADGLCKGSTSDGIIGRRTPGSGIAGEDLYGIAADLPGDLGGLDQFGVRGHVAANAHSSCVLSIIAVGNGGRDTRWLRFPVATQWGRVYKRQPKLSMHVRF